MGQELLVRRGAEETFSFHRALAPEEARHRTRAGSRFLRRSLEQGRIAVSGEVTLHHDHVYVQVGQFGLSSGHGILIRACKGRKDYTGGPNHFLPLSKLDDIAALAAAIHAITGVGRDSHNASRAA